MKVYRPRRFLSIFRRAVHGKNEFFVNSAESSRLIYDFVLKSMTEAGVGMPFFPRRSFLCGVVPPTEILPPSWPAGTAQTRSAGFFPYADAYAFSSPSLCAGRALSSPPYSPRRLSRCSSGAMCAFSRGRSQPGARKTRKYLSYRNRFFGSFRLLKSCFRQRKGLCFLPLPELQGDRACPTRQGKDPHHLPALRLCL